MPKYGGKDAAVFLCDGYSLLAAKVKELREKVIVGLERSDGLGDAWDESTPTGHASAELSQAGAFYDDATNNIHEAMSGKGAISRLVCYAFEGNTIGKRITLLAGAFGWAYERLATVAMLHKANVDYQVSGQVDEGRILHAHSAETADVPATTTVDHGAPTTNGAIGMLQVSALTLDGYDDAVVKIRHSDDDVTYADLITFAAVTTAPSAQRLTVAGTVERYLQTSLAFSGAGTSPSITYLVAAARG